MILRKAEIVRNTNETKINLNINLDDPDQNNLSTGLPFFDHMLHQFISHGRIGLNLKVIGDLEIDGHHVVEDVGICLGQAVHKCLGDKNKVVRFAHSYVPLDESLSRVVVDISGRPGLFFNVSFTRGWVGEFDLDLIREFFQAFVNHSMITLHVDNLSGINAHHQCESIFKAFGLAFANAVKIDPTKKITSTKGLI
jgi:imidazoleglycerol-phosphate dehydratase